MGPATGADNVRHRRIARPGLVGDGRRACPAGPRNGTTPGASGPRRRGHLVRRRGRDRLRSSPTGRRRPLARRPPAHGLGGRPLGRHLQRRVLQRRRAAGRPAGPGPRPQGTLRHRGGGGGGGRLGPAPNSRPARCDVRPGPVGPPRPRAAPGPGPPRREAAVLLGEERRRPLRLGAARAPRLPPVQSGDRPAGAGPPAASQLHPGPPDHLHRGAEAGRRHAGQPAAGPAQLARARGLVGLSRRGPDRHGATTARGR